MSAPRPIEDTQFRLLVERIRDYAIFLVDPEGRIATWNIGAERIKGYRADEVIGQPLSLFYPPEDAAAGKPQRLLRAAAEHGSVEDQGWRVRKDGSRFWADVVITALRDDQDRLLGYAKVTRDLTQQRAGEEALLRSEESLAATLYSIGDGVLATDEHARITRINPVAERLTGWREPEALGRPVEEVFVIINEETRELAFNPVSRVLAEGVVVGLANHTALIHRDGKECPIADSGAPIRDAHGFTRGAVLVFRDVSDERRADEALRLSEERLKLMLGSITEYAIFMLDPKGRISSWNPGAERITGFRSEDILGADFSRLFVHDDLVAGKPARELELAARYGRFEDEAWRLRKDGSRFWASVVVSPMRDSDKELVGFVKVTRDLTERREMESEHLRAAQAREAVRLRDEFLLVASHELTTPLTALLLQLQTVREQSDAVDPAMARKVTRALEIGERMARLIETLLDVSRIASGTLTLQPVLLDLLELARESVDRMSDTAARAGCTLSVSGDPLTGRWDRLRLDQVLVNLISNAAKYAAGSAISITIERDGNEAVLRVSDGGPGVPPEDLLRIFDRFERSSPTRHYGGLGLGLYVVRQIVSAHGGTVSACNLPDGGACFTVRLPRSR